MCWRLALDIGWRGEESERIGARGMLMPEIWCRVLGIVISVELEHKLQRHCSLKGGS